MAYDIGCSTGTLTVALARHNLPKKGARFVGVDIELGMIEKAMDRTADARADLSTALGINPHFSILWAGRAARILSRMGESA